MKQANDNGYLFETEVQEIEQAVQRQPDLDLTAFRVFAVRTLTNPEAEVSKYHVADTDSGSAMLIRGLADYPQIRISGSEITNNIYKVGVAFAIPTADVEQSRDWGRSLDLEFVDRAKREVDSKMNKFMYIGDNEFGINGIYDLSGVTTYSGTDFDTASLNITNEMTAAVNTIPIQFRNRPYSLVIADQEWKKAQKIGNTYSNETWLDMFKKQHPNITVEVESVLDAGTVLGSGGTVSQGSALLIPKDRGLCRVPIGYLGQVLFKPEANATFDEKIEAKVKSRLGAIEVPFATSVVKITGWNT